MTSKEHAMKNENEKCLFSNTQEFLHNIFITSFKIDIKGSYIQ